MYRHIRKTKTGYKPLLSVVAALILFASFFAFGGTPRLNASARELSITGTALAASELSDTGTVSSAYDFSVVGVSKLPSGFDASKLWYDAPDYLNMPAVAAKVRAWASAGLLPDPTADDFEPIKIAVIDTGIFFGQELYEGLYCYGADGKRLSYDSYMDIEGENAAQADLSEDHGPHVIGTISAFVKELGLQDYIKILPIKAVSVESYPNGEPQKSFMTTHVIRAMEWAHAKGADVITMSLGSQGELTGAIWKGGYMTYTMEKIKRDCIVLAAAGNEGADSVGSPHYPSLVEGFLSVMSYRESMPERRLSSFSNYGGYSIAAPGSSVYSVAYKVNEGKITYDYKQGTSMATPVAAAAAGLLTLRYRYVEKTPGFDALALTEIMKKHSDVPIYKKDGMSAALPSAAYALLPLALVTEEFDLNGLYLAPEQVRLTVAGYLDQSFGRYSEIKFTTSVYPFFTDPAVAVKWFVNGEKVQEGDAFSFTPFELGTTEIYAEAGGVRSKTVTVRAAYETVYSYMCAITASNEKPKIKQEVVLKLSGAEHADPSRIIWFVDGEEYASGVNEITLSYDKGAEVTVVATVDGEEVVPYILTVVDYTVWIVLAVVGGALLIAAIVVAAVLRRKRTMRYYEPAREDFEDKEE
ncbi:MAG: S8 family serine peptidase [Clostridiaceae bacterium]|nr:S8 family serine peptidase [Clostridiaceae bacterium]